MYLGEFRRGKGMIICKYDKGQDSNNVLRLLSKRVHTEYIF